MTEWPEWFWGYVDDPSSGDRLVAVTTSKEAMDAINRLLAPERVEWWCTLQPRGTARWIHTQGLKR